MASFYGWGSTTSMLDPLGGSSLLFTTKFPEIPGTHFINLRRMEGLVDLGANPSGFEHETLRLEIQRLSHYVTSSILF